VTDTDTRHTIQNAVRALAGTCDGAKTRDDHGFNGRDTRFGKSLAAIPHDNWSEKQLSCAHRMLRTYRVQLLRVHGIDYDQLPAPAEAWEASRQRRLARRLEQPAHPQKTIELARVPSRRGGTVERYALRFPYDPNLIASVKALPGSYAQRNGRGWVWYAYTDRADVGRSLVALGERYGFEGVDAVRRRLLALEASVEASSAMSADAVEVSGLNPEVTLRPYQHAALAYFANHDYRCLLADQMGTGKTGVALCALAQRNAYPALVVPPASAKGVWRQHVERWFPGRTVEVCKGRRYQPSGEADIYVANYELLSDRQIAGGKPWERELTGLSAKLAALGLRGLVVDESHYVKEPKSLRSKAVRTHAQQIPSDGCTLLLTGTPVKNRPIELAHQLDCLGLLQRFGGRMAFAKRYCQAHKKRAGRRLVWDMSGSSNLQELNERLRQLGYVRRTKDQVLAELPAKIHSSVPMELKNRAQYQRAERDLIRWLKETKGSEAAARARRAEALVRVGQLKQLCVKLKLDAVKRWVQDYLDADPDHKLLLFAHHVEAQELLAEALPGCAVLRAQGRGPAGEVDEEKARFQDELSCRVIVASLQAGGVAHTLTAATAVAFAELGWTPADQEQAEDRVHRLDEVMQAKIDDGVRGINIYHLVAEGTIDQEIEALLAQKRAVVDLATDGTDRERARQESVADALLVRLAQRTK